MLDPRLLHVGSSGRPDDAILDAMNAGADFRSAFQEFDTFRKFYANAQSPRGSLDPPRKDQRRQYVLRLWDKLHVAFRTKLTISYSDVSTPVTRLSLAIAFNGSKVPEGLTDGTLNQFVSNSIVSRGQASNSCLLVKTLTRHAWTIEQAVADAVAICREMRSPR